MKVDNHTCQSLSGKATPAVVLPISPLRPCQIALTQLQSPAGQTACSSGGKNGLTCECEASHSLQQSCVNQTSQDTSLNEDLRHLCCRIWESQEKERNAISRELYKEIANQIAISRLFIDRAIQSPRYERAARLHQVQSFLHNVLKQVTDLSLNLRPQMLDDLGILPTAVWYVDQFIERTHIPVIFNGRGMERVFTAEENITIYRILEEALEMGNVAEAREMAISLEADARAVAFRASYLDCQPLVASVGALALRQRVISGGGRLEIDNRFKGKALVTAEIILKTGADQI